MKNWLIFIYLIFSYSIYAQWIRELSPAEINALPRASKDSMKALLKGPQVTRYRVVFINISDFIAQTEQGSVDFVFFNDAAYQIDVNLKKKIYQDSYLYSGKAKENNNPDATFLDFTFSISEKYLAFHLQDQLKFFTTRAIGPGIHLILESDATRFPGDDYVIDPKARPTQKINSSQITPVDKFNFPPDLDWEQEATIDNGNFFDMFVVYTNATKALAPDIVAQIYLAIGLANEAYKNSEINTRMRLVQVLELDYTEGNDFTTELNRLSGTADGYNDGIHELKTKIGADFVALVSSIVAGLCGLAQVGSLPANSSRVFSVTETSCITNYTFHHEVGHNMGNLHITPGGVYSYSHGYFSGTLFRTVMSTTNECAGCPRKNYFSNPNIKYQGVAMGNATANVAQSINNLATSFSGYLAGFHTDNLDIEEDSLVNADCFIATAAYGTRFHKDIKILQAFRDHVLKRFSWGKALVQLYETHSPPLAYYIQKRPLLRKLTIYLIAPIIFVLKYFWWMVAILFSVFMIKMFSRTKIAFGVFFILFLSLTPNQLHAQIALPYLDQAFPILMPAALGWREQHRAAVIASYQLEERPVAIQYIKADTSRMDALASASYASKAIAFEAALNRKISTTEHANGKDTYTDNFLSASVATSLFAGGRFGLSFQNSDQTVNTSTRFNKNTAAVAGYSYGFLDRFFLAAGLKYNRNSQDKVVTNFWFERSIAAAVRLFKFGPQVEIGWIHSPRRKQKAENDLRVNHHARTDIFLVSVEMQVLILLAHIDYKKHLEYATSELDNDHKYQILTVGASLPALIPGLTIGGYLSKGEHLRARKEQEMIDADKIEFMQARVSTTFNF